MTDASRFGAAVVVCLLIAAWILRFEITTASEGSQVAAYKLDRWSGSVTYFLAGTERPMRYVTRANPD